MAYVSAQKAWLTALGELTPLVRETPYSLNYHPNAKAERGSRLIDEPDGKNVKYWAIRSEVPKPVMQGYGKRSTTLWANARYD